MSEAKHCSAYGNCKLQISSSHHLIFMSRIGKKEIVIPEGVQVSLSDGALKVKGPKGELQRQFLPDINIEISGKTIKLVPVSQDVFRRSLWGTYGSHIANMIEGVTKGFEKKLLIEGTGYKWEITGQKIKLALGFSHPMWLELPAGLTVKIDKGELTLSGADKELVGSFAAKIRSLKKPEPYKGKGIRYAGEVIERKQGKRSTT